jgi:hypothetical protein
VDIDRALENIRENIKISAEESLSYHELKKHKSLFDKGCSKLYIKGNKPDSSGYRIQVK